MGRSKNTKLSARSLEVVGILRASPELSYRDIDRQLNKYPGYARYHAGQYMEITGETLFDETDVYGRGTPNSQAGERARPETLSPDDISVAKMRARGVSYARIEKDEYYGYTAYHTSRYRRVCGEIPAPRGQKAIGEEEEKTIVRMASAGAPLPEICRRTGLTRYTVDKYINATGLADEYAANQTAAAEARRTEMSAEARRMRQNGDSFATIARMLTTTTQLVKQMLEDSSPSDECLSHPLRRYLAQREVHIIIILRGSGDILATIADMFGSSKTSIGAVLRKLPENEQTRIGQMQALRRLGQTATQIADAVRLSEGEGMILEERMREQDQRQRVQAGEMNLSAQDLEAYARLSAQGLASAAIAEALCWSLRKTFSAAGTF